MNLKKKIKSIDAGNMMIIMLLLICFACFFRFDMYHYNVKQALSESVVDETNNTMMILTNRLNFDVCVIGAVIIFNLMCLIFILNKRLRDIKEAIEKQCESGV